MIINKIFPQLGDDIGQQAVIMTHMVTFDRIQEFVKSLEQKIFFKTCMYIMSDACSLRRVWI